MEGISFKDILASIGTPEWRKGFVIGVTYPFHPAFVDDMNTETKGTKTRNISRLVPPGLEKWLKASRWGIGLLALALTACAAAGLLGEPTKAAVVTDTPQPVSSPAPTEHIPSTAIPTEPIIEATVTLAPTVAATSTATSTDLPAPSETPVPGHWENTTMAGAGGELLPDGWKFTAMAWNPYDQAISAFATSTGYRTYADFGANVVWAEVQPDPSSARTFITAPRPQTLGTGSLDESLSQNNLIYGVYPQANGSWVINVNAWPRGGNGDNPLALFIRPTQRTIGMSYQLQDGSFYEEGGHVSIEVPANTIVETEMSTFQVIIKGPNGDIIVPFGNEIGDQTSETLDAEVCDGVKTALGSAFPGEYMMWNANAENYQFLYGIDGDPVNGIPIPGTNVTAEIAARACYVDANGNFRTILVATVIKTADGQLVYMGDAGSTMQPDQLATDIRDYPSAYQVGPRGQLVGAGIVFDMDAYIIANGGQPGGSFAQSVGVQAYLDFLSANTSQLQEFISTGDPGDMEVIMAFGVVGTGRNALGATSGLPETSQVDR